MKLYNLRDDNKRLQEEITELKERLRIADFIKKLEEEVIKIESQIKLFKLQTKKQTKWKKGKDIREYLDKIDCVNWGRFLGKRDVLQSLIKELEGK